MKEKPSRLARMLTGAVVAACLAMSMPGAARSQTQGVIIWESGTDYAKPGEKGLRAPPSKGGSKSSAGTAKQLKSNQPAVKCDCTNCSASHWGPGMPAWHEGVQAGGGR